jgi:hypothetical protein
VAKYIKSLEFVSDFKKLSSGGKNALCIDRGNVRKGSEFSRQKPAKSIDFFELSRIIKEKIFASMLFINTSKKVAEPKITNLKKLKTVLK